MKIRILGGPGTGKTYISKKIEDKFKVKKYSLDDIYWNEVSGLNNGGYVKRENDIRDKLFDEIINRNNWIIEGVYCSEWAQKSFKNADKIYIIKISRIKQISRLILRFIKRKIKIESSSRKESIFDLIKLIKWSKGYNKRLNGEIIPNLKKFEYVKIINSYKDIVNEFNFRGEI